MDNKFGGTMTPPVPTAGQFTQKTMPPAASQVDTRPSVKMDEEPAWKSDFRKTLDEINELGFGAYAEEIHVKKMEELREKILAAMGLSEDELSNMPPDQRQRIEKMIAQEIQKRLAAEDAIDTAEQANNALSNANPNGLAGLMRAMPGGLGEGVVLMQALDQASQQTDDAPSPTGHKKVETG